MKVAIIGLGRMGIVQARLARYFGDTLCFGVDCEPVARDYFIQEFGVPTFSDVHAGNYASVDLLWITVKDDVIGHVAQELVQFIPSSCIVLHTSGVLSSG